MAWHDHGDEGWWCLPGGGVEPGETPAEAALRELAEECNVRGTVVRELSCVTIEGKIDTCTFLVDIGDQTPSLGHDPEVAVGKQAHILTNIRWLRLSEIPERDRAFLWASGLLGVPAFLKAVYTWGDDPSYPESQS